MTEGLKFMTIGGSEELIIGNDYSATLGMTNYVYVGAETTFNAGMVNEFCYAAKFVVEGGVKYEWNHTKGITWEDGHVIELGDSVHKQAGESLTFTAGYTADDLVTATAALNAAKATLKNTVKLTVALNTALGLGISAAMVSSSNGDNEQNVTSDDTAADNWVTAGLALEGAVLGTAASATGCIAMKQAMTALTDAYKALEKVSTMIMDGTGIVQNVDIGAVSSNVHMSATGVVINSGTRTLVPATEAIPFAGYSVAAPDSSLNLTPGLATITSSGMVNAGQLAEEILLTGLSATKAEVVLKNLNSAVCLTEEEISILSGLNGFTVNLKETKMASGANSFQATPWGLSLTGAKVGLNGGSDLSLNADGLITIG